MVACRVISYDEDEPWYATAFCSFLAADTEHQRQPRKEESEREDPVFHFELLVIESGRDGVIQLHYLSQSSISYKYVYNITHKHR